MGLIDHQMTKAELLEVDGAVVVVGTLGGEDPYRAPDKPAPESPYKLPREWPSPRRPDGWL